MSYIALYRKYRPQTFSDVVGQEYAVELLTSAIKQQKISHAYLFCGGRGTGKTTMARIVAREIGCNDEDIIEIDAASNRGIDEIRELREAVRTAPFSSPYKVYIIDEAHMLTKEAANALLKTLEEPPSHVVFILATTDPDKLPQTIVSRCQKVVFNTPDLETLTKRLLYITEKEGKPAISPEGARAIAHHGKGSYRDAVGILEQIRTSAGNVTTIADETIHRILGIPSQQLIVELLASLCTKDAASLLATCKRLETGSATRAYDDLIDHVREGLLVRVGETTTNEKVATLAKEYPLVIGSKLLLDLLEKRHLLEVSEAHSWAAFEAILLNQIES
ncbi:MAG: polymerase subunit tau [Candidatus Parcubacteria bacterium]|jgi:DNA polymerase-3 subunit gamma/tau